MPRRVTSVHVESGNESWSPVPRPGVFDHDQRVRQSCLRLRKTFQSSRISDLSTRDKPAGAKRLARAQLQSSVLLVGSVNHGLLLPERSIPTYCCRLIAAGLRDTFRMRGMRLYCEASSVRAGAFAHDQCRGAGPVRAGPWISLLSRCERRSDASVGGV